MVRGLRVGNRRRVRGRRVDGARARLVIAARGRCRTLPVAVARAPDGVCARTALDASGRLAARGAVRVLLAPVPGRGPARRAACAVSLGASCARAGVPPPAPPAAAAAACALRGPGRRPICLRRMRTHGPWGGWTWRWAAVLGSLLRHGVPRPWMGCPNSPKARTQDIKSIIDPYIIKIYPRPRSYLKGGRRTQTASR